MTKIVEKAPNIILCVAVPIIMAAYGKYESHDIGRIYAMFVYPVFGISISGALGIVVSMIPKTRYITMLVGSQIGPFWELLNKWFNIRKQLILGKGEEYMKKIAILLIMGCFLWIGAEIWTLAVAVYGEGIITYNPQSPEEAKRKNLYI